MDAREYLEQQTLDRLNAADPTTKDLADGIKMLYSRLWSKDELTAYIVQTHHTLCASCTRISKGKGEQSDKEWYQKVIWLILTAACSAVAYFVRI